MFGPNVSTKIDCDITFHHREDGFINLYTDTLALFRAKFEIPADYEIVIYTGSGTLAVEAFIASFNRSMRIDSTDIANEKFASRWKGLLEHYGKYDPKSEYALKVQFETSRSLYNGDFGATFVDAVSGFPFWPAPSSPAWSTVSSKLIGAAPVLSILVVQKDFLHGYIDNNPSYLNPFKYLEAQRSGQTPFTPAIPLFMDLRDKLRRLDVADLRYQVERNFWLLADVIGMDHLINTDVSPVLTIQPGRIPPEIAERWSLYGYKGSGNIQIFLYSESEENYERLAQEIYEATHPGRHNRFGHDDSRP